MTKRKCIWVFSSKCHRDLTRRRVWSLQKLSRLNCPREFDTLVILISKSIRACFFFKLSQKCRNQDDFDVWNPFHLSLSFSLDNDHFSSGQKYICDSGGDIWWGACTCDQYLRVMRWENSHSIAGSMRKVRLCHLTMPVMSDDPLWLLKEKKRMEIKLYINIIILSQCLLFGKCCCCLKESRN